jgi:hypothetical protein
MSSLITFFEGGFCLFYILVGIVLIVAGVTGQSMSTPVRAMIMAAGLILVMKEIGGRERKPYKVSDEQYKKIEDTKKYGDYRGELAQNEAGLRDAREKFLDAYGRGETNISKLDTTNMTPTQKLAYNTYLLKRASVKKRNFMTDKKFGKSHAYFSRKKSKGKSKSKPKSKSKIKSKKRSNK